MTDHYTKFGMMIVWESGLLVGIHFLGKVIPALWDLHMTVEGIQNF